MIRVTKLSGQEYFMDADKVEIIESVPDTLITLVTGRRLFVRETPDEVVERITLFRRHVFTGRPRTAPRE